MSPENHNINSIDLSSSKRSGLTSFLTVLRVANLFSNSVHSVLLKGPAMRAFATVADFNVEIDYYAALGLKKNASMADVKKKFYQLAKKHHPDAVGNCPKNEEKFKKITAAYEVLGSSDKRK